MKDNPFQFGTPVEAPYYFERTQLRESCEGLLSNGIPLMLSGSRRLGKTSFARNLCKSWQSKKIGSAFVLDVYNVSNHQDFLLQLLYVLQSQKTIWEKVQGWIKTIPEKLKPNNLSVENESFGKITLQWLSEHGEHEKKLYIKQALESLEKLDGRTCFIIDECQQIAKESLDDDGWLEATLRQYIQQQAGKVSYLLTGSRRDIVHAMVNDNRRPLYRTLNIIEFPPIGQEFTPWISKKCHSVGCHVEEKTIDYLRHQVNDSPNYVQMACFHLVATGQQQIDRTAIDTILAKIALQNAYSYETHLHNLSPVQQRVLRMAAIEEEGYFSEPLLRQYEISTTAHVTNAFNALKKKNILDQDTPGRGRVSFDDPLFRLWLRIKFGHLTL